MKWITNRESEGGWDQEKFSKQTEALPKSK